MTYSDKQILFESFLQEWGLKFNQIPFILNYISSYPELASRLQDFQALSPEGLKESQLEWISLISQFDRDTEKVFFKPYWVPIQSNSYNYFIDLSSASLPIFEASYFFFEPCRWFKKYLFKDITEFLTSVDNPSISLDKLLEANDEEGRLDLKRLFNERDKLGFSGKSTLRPIEKDCLFETGRKSSYKLNKETITFSGIKSIGISLLPFEHEIILNHFDTSNNYDKNVKVKIRNINALTYLLQSVGPLSVKFYHLSFKSDVDCYAEFEDNILTIRHTDKSLLKQLIEKYKIYLL